MEAVEKRNIIIDYIRRQTFGPSIDEDEEMPMEPWRYYITGVLFPLEQSEIMNFKYVSMEDGTDGEESSDTTVAEQVSTLSGKLFPSSMGIEARVAKGKKRVNIIIHYAAYIKKEGREKIWRRKRYEIEIKLPEIKKNKVIDRRLEGVTAYVRIIARKIENVLRLKVFLVNDGRKSSPDDREVGKYVYQPEIIIESLEGSELIPFPSTRVGTSLLEDRLLYMRHRKNKIYAASYGCAAQWDVSPDEPCKRVKTTFIPRCEIKPLTFEIGGLEKVLSQHYLSYGILDNYKSVIPDLKNFVSGYVKWIENLLLENGDLDLESEEVRVTISDCYKCAERMNEGIRIIENDPDVREAFALANLSMLMQAVHRDGIVKPAKKYDPLQDYRDQIAGYSWRPFQLAFLLLSIEPASDPGSRYRDFVDLIWFPTGGGKTEAYLCVTAYTIIHQRLLSPEAEYGTTVLSRYTLRLLTAQQFERTAVLTCALELMRRLWPEKLGKTPISLGLWLGEGMTPNRIQRAEIILDQLFMDDEPYKNNPFMLNDCPCCGSPLLPQRRGVEKDYGFEIKTGKLLFNCIDKSCPMTDGIPVAIVDDQIYEELPTIIIGTIDKFARLTWLERAGWLLNGKGGVYPPPRLIIQDELHLIAGPLGSLAGVYETAIEALCGLDGNRPHIIASTATVRQADEQCRALYGRQVRQFPPPGLDEADSFFARKDQEAPGRVYTGVMAPHITGITAAVRLHAILLQSQIETKGPGDLDDNYWTLVSYFNSIRELGSATTLAADDIPDRIQVIQPDRESQRSLQSNNFIDLYSARKGAELTDILKRLQLEHNKPDEISLLLTTNIISVGVDVDRLGFMLVNGQPKTTAEYIQATSRIGRSINMPGLVVSLYSAVKPRDRSHFESFIPYHSSLYSFVEPSSVTPFSKPSREKALHAVMVILARHLPDGLPRNDQASIDDSNSELIKIIEKVIVDRCRLVAQQEFNELKQELLYRFKQWRDWSREALHYDSSNTAITSLLHRKLDTPDHYKGWRAMDSMRSVDFETKVQIEGAPR
ncbi:helicase-related protein [Thermodesulfobacteriota bacterium]